MPLPWIACEMAGFREFVDNPGRLRRFTDILSTSSLTELDLYLSLAGYIVYIRYFCHRNVPDAQVLSSYVQQLHKGRSILK